ncbi:peptidase S8 [Marinobacter similis]|uniref:Peptidase S8 n=2 Tax=Marinobacter similis TaxID=1420916 RepID=W5YJV1_9GAMM|nr:peptidase S8 [Marinobacter similis]
MGIFRVGKRQQGMKTNRFFSHHTLACLLGLGLTVPTPAFSADGLTGPALNRLNQQVERAVSRQIERQLDKASERLPESALPAAPATPPELPARLAIQSDTGLELFADVEVEDGWRAVERQWLVTVNASDTHHFNQPGITVIDQTPMAGLGLTVLRFRVSPGLDSRDQLQELLPKALAQRVDRNHIYRPETDASNHQGPSTTDEPPSCPVPVSIGMVDTAVETDHPAFAGTTVVQRDFLQDLHLADSYHAPTDHGTAVASRLAGKTSANAATRLPSATLFSASVFYGQPASVSGATLLHLVEGLAWLESNDVTLINVSMAGPDNRVLATVIKRLIDRGTPVVAAVGNEGPAAPVLYPAGYPEVIGVTAVNQHRKIYRWANRGEQVDFAAPGVDVAVALTDGQYGSQSGTSLAAPVVSAQLACALASTSLENALAQLTRRADDLGDQGRDPVFGYGLLPDTH